MEGIFDLTQLKQNKAERSINIEEFNQKRSYYNPALNEEKVTYLSKEPTNEIVFEFSTTKKVIKSPKNAETKLLIKRLSFFLGSLILLTGIFSAGYIKYYKTEPFYLAIWKGMLSEEEKSQGVKDLSYEFKEDALVEKIVSKSNDIEISAKLSSKIEFTNRFKNSATFEVERKGIDSIDIDVPDSYCGEDKSNCNELKENFKKTFREKIEAQNKQLINKKFKITKLNGSQLRLQSDVVGDRLLKAQG